MRASSQPSSTPSRLEPGKKMLFVITQGADDESAFSDIFPKYKEFFAHFGCGADLDQAEDVLEQILFNSAYFLPQFFVNEETP